MYLKRVEMENFKSFRQQEVPFEPGFTGITGPNGSGKSNISDAILFVLGTTSSKQIRAGRLADLIHNGGANGDPRDECKVSLVLANEDRTIPVDEDEIKLTRRIKRSPSDPERVNSYYYVNGETSSLTEFQDLLSHARISADGYNIVQQGDVTRIVSMSTTERRGILDEIAGITRFDEELEDAEAQRDEVEDNLERTRLILHEVQSKLKQLADEKERAQEYRELQDELKQHKARLAKKRIEGLEQELANVHESIESYEEEGEELEAEKEKIQAELEEVEAELEELDEEMADLGGEEAKQRQEKLQELREDLATARQMANHFRNELQEVKIELKEAQADHSRAEEALDEVLEEREDVDEALESWREQADDLEVELGETKERISQGSDRSHELQRELAQLKQTYEEVQADHHEARMEVESLEEKVQRLEAELSDADEKLETAEYEAKDLQYAAREAKKEHDSLQEKKEELNDQLFEKQKRQAEIQEQLDDLEPTIRDLRNEYNQLKAEFDAQGRVGGFSRAVEGVLEARDTGQIDGICGTIAELGEPESKDLEKALEIAAGGSMQAVVVEDDEVASEAIDYLKANNLGRVKFLPLNKLSYRRPQGQALMASRDDEAVGFAIDLLDFDEKYKPAFSYVFRSTLVVEHLEAARRLMGGVRMVTKEGEKIDAGGAMTGGSTKKRSGGGFDVQRKDSLEDLGDELRAKVTQKETLESQLEAAEDEVRQIREQMREVERDVVKQESEREEAQRKAEQAEERIEELEEKKEQIAGKLAEAREELEHARNEAQGTKQRMEKLDAKREEMSEELMETTQEQLADKLEDLREELDDVKDSIRDLEARQEALEEKERMARERRDELAQGVEELKAERDEHKAEIAGYEEKQENLEEEIEVLEELVGQHDEQMEALREERDELLERKYQLENERDRVQDNIDANSDLIVQFRGRIPVIESNLEEAREELADMETEPPESVDATREAIKEDVRHVESRMEELEPVNMRALEEYEEQEQRRDELEAELERLEKERESLIELADELLGRKKQALMKVFDEVNENFQTIFEQLSGGGSARLKLENEVDPFDGGLILESQPRGKSVHRLEALSGGEKSLTALSFIFAIQQYAPSPFYVLDEVDMFLDGVNSELVANMVREQADRAQFIMVSLRKVTLKMADHVYGVTMREGVTQVLGTVDVDEIAHEELKEA